MKIYTPPIRLKDVTSNSLVLKSLTIVEFVTATRVDDHVSDDNSVGHTTKGSSLRAAANSTLPISSPSIVIFMVILNILEFRWI